jgi:peptide/nickel transport system substrate-binding protein
MRRTARLGATLTALAILTTAGSAVAQAPKKALVVALNQDPDILDPTLSQSYVGRIVFASMCEKLYDIDENLTVYPQLAAELPRLADGGKTVTIKLRTGIKFNDGTLMDAAAVKFSLDRHREMKGSNRRSELNSVNDVEVVDPATIRLRLKSPFAPLVAILADRAGMPVSPAQAKKLDDKFGTQPICVGPWTFKERVPQDRIILERSTHYVDPKAAGFDQVVFRIIANDNVRLANLRSGDIDLMHRVAPSDAVSLHKEGRFEVSNVTGLGYNAININLRNKTGKQNPPGDLGTPLANDPRVREAFELSIDRVALNQVAWEGQYTPDCTPISPVSPFYDKARKCPGRDVARAKKLLADAGLAGGYAFELTLINDPQQRRVGEILQGMAKDAGFTVSLKPTEFASLLTQDDAGAYQATLIGWSGRLDPDANIHQFQTCTGSLNTTHVCDETVDTQLNRAREVSDLKERFELYRQAVDRLVGSTRSIIYLYHDNYLVAFPKNLKGYKAVPDGLIRLKSVTWN